MNFLFGYSKPQLDHLEEKLNFILQVSSFILAYISYIHDIEGHAKCRD